MSNFNVNLKNIREKKGLTAKEVAIDLGIPYTTYLKYEGVGEPRYDTLIKIADYLNVSIDTLLGYTPNEYEYYKQWLLSTNQIEIDEKKPIGALNIIQPSPYSEKLKYNSYLHLYYLYIGKTLCFYPPYKKILPNMPIPNPPFSIGPQCNYIN